MEHTETGKPEPGQMSGAALAYLGDAVLEILVRERLVGTGIAHAGKLNDLSKKYVTAVKQSAGLEVLLPLLTEEETAVFHRGRNAAGQHPKSASVAEYRRATGFEALFGYLWLSGKTERLYELFTKYAQTAEEE